MSVPIACPQDFCLLILLLSILIVWWISWFPHFPELVKPQKTFYMLPILPKSLSHTWKPLGLEIIILWCWQGHVYPSHCPDKPSETQRGQGTYVSSHSYQRGRASIPILVSWCWCWELCLSNVSLNYWLGRPRHVNAFAISMTLWWLVAS